MERVGVEPPSALLTPPTVRARETIEGVGFVFEFGEGGGFSGGIRAA